jgi:hypothetical protein
VFAAGASPADGFIAKIDDARGSLRCESSVANVEPAQPRNAAICPVGARN